MTAPLRVCIVGLFVSLVALSHHQATAQSPSSPSPPDTSRVQWQATLPPLTVTASRVPSAPATGPARVSVIDSSALRATGAFSVADALEARAGFHVRQYGDGGLATPSLRGTGASQSLLLLDGQPLTDPQIGHLDLSLLPTVLLQSVEVLHGPASPMYGSSGMGGAIHLRTLTSPSSLRARLRTHAGAFGERGGSALLGTNLSPETGLVAAAEYRQTDGDFPYTDRSQFPPQTVQRRNADREHLSLYSSTHTRVGPHRIRLAGWLTQAERGLPGTSGSAQEARQWDTQLRFWGRDVIPLDEGLLTARGLVQYNRLRYVNRGQDLDQTSRTALASLETDFRTRLTDHWEAAGGLSSSFGYARHPRLADEARQHQMAMFTEGKGEYGRVRLFPALRLDAYWLPQSSPVVAVTPRLGINVQPVAAWPNFRAKAQVGRAFRVPTLNDRYWQPGGTPSLKPEHSWSLDLGLRLDGHRSYVEVTAFGQRRRNQIVWQPTGEGYWSPVNVGRVRALGIEAAGSSTWLVSAASRLEIGLTSTFTDARDRSQPGSPSYNEPLRYVPKLQIKPFTTVTYGPVSLDVNARFIGRRYITSDGSKFLDPYALIDAQLQLTHSFDSLTSTLSLQIDNVTNSDYRGVGNRPMPPRHARIQLSLEL